MPKTIAIICPFEFADSIPCVRNFAVMLARSGVRVELFVSESDSIYTPLTLEETNLYVHRLPLKKNLHNLLRHTPYLSTFVGWVARNCIGKNISTFVGIDPSGLVCATILGSMMRRPWIYFSLEIPVLSDPESMYRRYKPYEVWASRRAALIIIQDEGRANVMAEENGIPMEKFAYLPNSPLGPAFVQKTSFLRDRLKISAEKKIILYSGSHGRSMYTRELAEVAQSFPEDWQMVFHFRWNHPAIRAHFGNLLDSDKIVISTKPVPYDELRSLVSSADVGVALYNQPNSPNTVFLGKSSGKLNQYLQCGLPVVTNRFPGWAEWLPKYCSGITVEHPKEVIGAVRTIFNDLSSYSQGSIKHFENELRFEPAFNSLLEQLRNLKMVA